LVTGYYSLKRRTQFVIMLQQAQAIRHYQKLTDMLVDLWNRGHRYEDLRMFMDGYVCSLRHSNSLEPYQIHRLEEEVFRFLRDPSNFELLPLAQVDYY